jgi:outer membrane protein OmpA-like peptidoglycan-associated protein
MFLMFSVFLVQAQPELGECEQEELDELAQKQIPRALKNWKAKNYREAERYLKKAIELEPEYADALFLLGDLYVRKSKLPRAVGLWSKLLEVCPNYKPELAYYLGAIQLEEGRRNEAIALFNTFLANPERDRGFDKEVKAALEEAKLKEKLLGNPIDFNPKALKGLSTLEDEYLATISPDQQTLYFTRRSKKVNRRDGPAARTRVVEEFSFSKRTASGDFEKGKPMESPFNVSYNEGGPSVTADNTELYFTVCQDIQGYKNCDIYFSEVDAYGYWSTPVSVGDHINTRDAWESQASVSANGDRLYFTSNRKGGVGGLDLYACYRQEDGKWSRPQNLGETVNTPKNEKTPFIHSDSETLYFTSDGHPGLGGFDIFYAKANLTDSTWNMPENIGFPINSKDDDLGLFVSLDGLTGYFASNKLRKGNGWDIYEFNLPPSAQPEKVALIQGDLTNENGEIVSDASMELKNLKTKEITKIKIDKETGKYARAVKISKNEDLIVTVKKKGAAFSSKYIDVDKELQSAAVVKAPLQVAKLEVGKEYKLNDINFNSNSFQLDDASRSVIDEFIIFLNENAGLRADIQGHTDNVGNPSDNRKLSQNRAKTVYDYVVAKGINASRLSHHGYGESKPIEENATEEGRARNRRTVFVITSR